MPTLPVEVTRKRSELLVNSVKGEAPSEPTNGVLPFTEPMRTLENPAPGPI